MSKPAAELNQNSATHGSKHPASSSSILLYESQFSASDLQQQYRALNSSSVQQYYYSTAHPDDGLNVEQPRYRSVPSASPLYQLNACVDHRRVEHQQHRSTPHNRLQDAVDPALVHVSCAYLRRLSIRHVDCCTAVQGTTSPGCCIV